MQNDLLFMRVFDLIILYILTKRNIKSHKNVLFFNEYQLKNG